MRWLGWVGLLGLLVACTIQEPIVVERSTAVLPTMAVVPSIATATEGVTAVPPSSPNPTGNALAVEIDTPATPQPPATPTLSPPATSTPTQFQPAFSHLDFREQIGGQIQAVKVTDGLAYVGVGPRLVALDVTNPAMPQKIGQSDILSGVVQDILLHDEMAYVATGEMGVWQIDVSQPQQPVIVQFITTSQHVNRLRANQTYLLAISPSLTDERQVSVIHLTTNREIGHLTLSGESLHETLAGNNLFTNLRVEDMSGKRRYEFSRWDISDPLNPKLTGTLPLSTSAYYGFLADSLAYLIDGLGGLWVVDVLDPSELSIVEHTENLVNPLDNVSQAIMLSKNTFLLAITTCDGGYCGGSLQRATKSEVLNLNYGWVGYITYDMSLENSIAYVAVGTDLVIVDLEGEGGFQVIGRFRSTGIVETLATNNQQLYSQNWFGETTNIYSLKHLDDPESYVQYQSNADVNEMIVVDNHLFFSTGRGLAPGDIRVFDIDDPLKPFELGTYKPETPIHSVRNTILSNGIAYYLFDDFGDTSFVVVDVRDVERMEEIGRFDEAPIGRFVLRDNWIYADSAILDISDLTNPQAVGQLPQLSVIFGMVVVNNRLYVLATADQQPYTLYTLDLSQPTNPQIIHEQEVDTSITNLAVYNNLLIGLGNDIWVFDISQADVPVLVSRFVTAGITKDAVVSNGRLYVADDAGGILVFEGVP